jgi:hypothetical protein
MITGVFSVTISMSRFWHVRKAHRLLTAYGGLRRSRIGPGEARATG